MISVSWLFSLNYFSLNKCHTMDLDSGPVTQQSENHIGHHDTVTSMLPTVSHHCFLFHFFLMNTRNQMEHYESLHL